ncbi:unnamed protein product, partial [Coregonus sp. 'balchen']
TRKSKYLCIGLSCIPIQELKVPAANREAQFYCRASERQKEKGTLRHIAERKEKDTEQEWRERGRERGSWSPGRVTSGVLLLAQLTGRTGLCRECHNLNFAKKHFPSFPLLPANCPVERCLNLNPYLKGTISRLYDMIQNINLPSWANTKSAWEQDMGGQLPDDIWQCSIERFHTSSFCIRHRLIQFKVLHRLHYSND